MCEGGNAFYQRATVYIVGYCRGVAIVVTFVDLQVMKFSTH